MENCSDPKDKRENREEKKMNLDDIIESVKVRELCRPKHPDCDWEFKTIRRLVQRVKAAEKIIQQDSSHFLRVRELFKSYSRRFFSKGSFGW